MTSPSDLLESDAYHDCNTITECAECGTAIDVEQDDHMVSSDDEYICSECLSEETAPTRFEKHEGEWE